MFDIFVAISRWLTASCLHHLPQITWYAARSSICTNTFVFPPVVFTVLKPVNCQILTNVYFWHFFSGRHIVTWFCVLWATVRQTPVKASGPQASLRKIHKTSNAKHDKPRPLARLRPVNSIGLYVAYATERLWLQVLAPDFGAMEIFIIRLDYCSAFTAHYHWPHNLVKSWSLWPKANIEPTKHRYLKNRQNDNNISTIHATITLFTTRAAIA